MITENKNQHQNSPIGATMNKKDIRKKVPVLETLNSESVKKISDLMFSFSQIRMMNEVDLKPYVTQRRAGDDEIFHLSLNNHGYFFNPQKKPTQAPVVPNGEFYFVVSPKPPCEVCCARSRHFIEFGFGHTSITLRKPVIFAGEANFRKGDLLICSCSVMN